MISSNYARKTRLRRRYVARSQPSEYTVLRFVRRIIPTAGIKQRKIVTQTLKSLAFGLLTSKIRPRRRSKWSKLLFSHTEPLLTTISLHSIIFISCNPGYDCYPGHGTSQGNDWRTKDGTYFPRLISQSVPHSRTWAFGYEFTKVMENPLLSAADGFITFYTLRRRRDQENNKVKTSWDGIV